MSRSYTNLFKDSAIENRSIDQIKTTDVNILLNRVRLDKKKTLKKKILVSVLMVSLVSTITIFFIF